LGIEVPSGGVVPWSGVVSLGGVGTEGVKGVAGLTEGVVVTGGGEFGKQFS